MPPLEIKRLSVRRWIASAEETIAHAWLEKGGVRDRKLPGAPGQGAANADPSAEPALWVASFPFAVAWRDNRREFH